MRASVFFAIASLAMFASGFARGFSQSECDDAASQGTWSVQFTLLDQSGEYTGSCPAESFTVGLPQAASGCAPGCTCSGSFTFDDLNPDIAAECELYFSQTCADGEFQCPFVSLDSTTQGYAVCVWISSATALPDGAGYDCRYGGTWTKQQ